MTTPPGWYPEPSSQLRYWDGQKWTEHVAAGSVPSGRSTKNALLSIGGILLALVVPMIGIIAGAISLIVGPQRKTGAAMVAISLVMMTIWFGLATHRDAEPGPTPVPTPSTAS